MEVLYFQRFELWYVITDFILNENISKKERHHRNLKMFEISTASLNRGLTHEDSVWYVLRVDGTNILIQSLIPNRKQQQSCKLQQIDNLRWR